MIYDLYSDGIHTDSVLTHNMLVELANVSKKIKTETHMMTTLNIVSGYITSTPIISSKINTIGRLKDFDRHLNNKKDKVAKKIERAYMLFRDSYLSLYEAIDVFVNILLVNTKEPITFHQAVGHLFRHKLITKEELNLLKLFNQIRNVIVHNLDASICIYIEKNNELLRLMENVIENVILFTENHKRKALFKAAYIVAVAASDPSSDLAYPKNLAETGEKALLESQEQNGEEPLGPNLHLIKTKKGEDNEK